MKTRRSPSGRLAAQACGDRPEVLGHLRPAIDDPRAVPEQYRHHEDAAPDEEHAGRPFRSPIRKMHPSTSPPASVGSTFRVNAGSGGSSMPWIVGSIGRSAAAPRRGNERRPSEDASQRRALRASGIRPPRDEERRRRIDREQIAHQPRSRQDDHEQGNGERQKRETDGGIAPGADRGADRQDQQQRPGEKSHERVAEKGEDAAGRGPREVPGEPVFPDDVLAEALGSGSQKWPEPRERHDAEDGDAGRRSRGERPRGTHAAPRAR